MSGRLAGGVRQIAIPLLVVGGIAAVFLRLSPAYDLEVFRRAGAAAVHGLAVYPRPRSPAVYSGFSFVYPYFAVWPFVPLAAMSTGLSTGVFFALSVSLVLGTCLAATNDPWRAALVLCTTFTITGLQLGALSPLLFAGVIFLWRLRDRPKAFALLAALVVGSKLFLAPMFVWVALARRGRAFVGASGVTLTLVGAGFVFGPLGPAPYAHLLSQLGTHEARSGFGLIGALMNLGIIASTTEAMALALTLAASVVGSAYIHYRRVGDERILFCSGIIASLILTPVLWSHYLVLLPAALVVLNARRRWFVLMALTSWAIAPPHGVHLDMDLIEGVASSSLWLAVAASAVGFAFVARPGPGRLQ